MSESGGSFWSQHFGNILIAVIGALGAIAAALIPFLLSRSDPAPAPPAPAAAKPEAAGTGEADKPKRSKVLVDLEKLQGTWEVVNRDIPAGIAAKKGRAAKTKGADDKDKEKPPTALWTFKDNSLHTRLVRADGSEGPALHGPFTLGQGRGGIGLFDFKCRAPNGIDLEWKGVYDFDGEFLRICYRVNREGDENAPGRAIVFNSDMEHGGGLYHRLKRRN